jgi:hypothetical protein
MHTFIDTLHTSKVTASSTIAADGKRCLLDHDRIAVSNSIAVTEMPAM